MARNTYGRRRRVKTAMALAAECPAGGGSLADRLRNLRALAEQTEAEIADVDARIDRILSDLAVPVDDSPGADSVGPAS